MFQFKPNESQLNVLSIDEIRRRVGLGIIIFFALGSITFNIISLITGFTLNSSTSTTSVSYASFILGFIFFGFAYLLYRNIQTKIILHLPIVALLSLFLTPQAELSFIILTLAILIYAAIITRLSVFAVLCVVVIGMSVIQQSNYPDLQYVMFSSLMITLTIAVFYVVNSFGNITSSAQRTNRLLQASSDIAQTINLELDMKQLLDNTVNIIRNEFNFYHVQVFLIDDNHEYANLVSSTGEAGIQLLARNHRLPIGSQSVIGRVTQVGEPVVAQNTDIDQVHALNELLPDTRAELALPIIDSSQIVGALDVQSVNADAFQPIDIQALQIITNQLSTAIRNARLFEQAQKNIQENQQLLHEYQTNLRQLDRLNSVLVKQSWGDYLQQTHVDGVTLSEQRFMPKAHWSDSMRIAMDNQKTQITSQDDVQIIAVPIILRDETLGVIEVEIDKDTQTSEIAELIQAISDRLAISLESARLFEETQEATLQEQQINEIVSNYEAAVTIDELLQVTLEQLQQSLGAEHGAIRLGTVDGGHGPTSNYNGNGGSPS